MQRWENVDPAELARPRARIDWQLIAWYAAASAISAAFWAALVLAYVWGQS